MRFEEIAGGYFDDGVTILDVRVKCPGLGGADYFVVCRAETGGKRFVAFGNGDTFSEAVRSFLARLENRSVNFKEEKPYVPK